MEHNPLEIWKRTRTVIGSALSHLDLQPSDLSALGITNQRETTVVGTSQPATLWQRDRLAGHPHATPWPPSTPTRAKHPQQDGLLPSTYFAAGKLQWMFRQPRRAGCRPERHALFGTIDTWLLWNLTGGRGGVHVTDVTNASRTMLMNLETHQWDDELSASSTSRAMLPVIRPWSDPGLYGAPPAARGGRSPSLPPSATNTLLPWARPAPSPARPKTHTAPATFWSSTPASRSFAARDADDDGLPDRRRQARLCARGLGGGHRISRAVAS